MGFGQSFPLAIIVFFFFAIIVIIIIIIIIIIFANIAWWCRQNIHLLFLSEFQHRLKISFSLQI
ncbi:MAG: hypothetical protein N7Q72_04745, partial [Spiroplasma sp. Tabriz.8]|nr:hypothetical protein [Spiroplasma sp. Tabriz.8]